MKICCTENKVSSIPKHILHNYSISYEEFSVLINKNYTVYAMTVYLGIVWYYIADEDYSDYPIWNPSLLFSVTNPHLSRYWIYSYKEGNNAEKRPRWAFPEWADNPDYYEKLIDGNNQELAIFARYKELMDLEFEDPNITEMAQKEEGWLICHSCFEAWKFHNTQDALVRCPKCKKVLINPNYDNL